MTKILKLYIAFTLLFSLILTISCKSVNNDLEKRIVNTLSEFGIKTDISEIKTNGNELNIKIFIFSPSFIDSETHKLSLSLLSYKLFDDFNNYNNVNYTIIDEKFEHEPIHYEMNKETIRMVYENFQNNPLFVDLLKYALNNMTQNDFLKFNNLISELHKLMPYEFNFKGSFWLLLENFSKSKSNVSDSLGYKHFRMFSKVTKVKEFKVDPIFIDSLFIIYNKKININ